VATPRTKSGPKEAEGPPTDATVTGASGLDRSEHSWPLQLITQLHTEVGQLTAKVDRLIGDLKDHTGRLAPLESGLQALVEAKKAPWWKKIDPANALLAAIGIVTLLLTLVLGNGRFEDMGKRIDQADKRAETVEQRSNRTEDRISAKLDQIQTDLATLKAERAVANPAK
jgi:outer membrane murein-binding lipoprotein Lpp